MTYRILDGRLQKQECAGGRWWPVDGGEESRVLEAASRLIAMEDAERARACHDAKILETA